MTTKYAPNGSKHPAPFSDRLMPVFASALAIFKARPFILDPFAGVGRVHELRGLIVCDTAGVELMPKWAAAHAGTMVGDSRNLGALGIADGTFDAVCTSPCYGNRMADHHDAADPCSCRKDDDGNVVRAADPACRKCKGSGLSPRRSYKHYYGDGFDAVPADANAGVMPFYPVGDKRGDAYRELHAAVWAECWRVLKCNGRLVLNIKDHMRTLKRGEPSRRMYVTAWHAATLNRLGFVPAETIKVPLAGFRHGENHGARIGYESVLVFDVPDNR